MSNTPLNPDQKFVEEIKQILVKARSQTYRAINHLMVESYWEIGKRIVEREQGRKERVGYGEGIIKKLSKELTEEFGKGFSIASLKNFRKFYLIFPDGQNPLSLHHSG